MTYAVEAMTGVLVIGFTGRWLVAPDSLALWQMLYVLGPGVAAYKLWTAHTYGRGPRV
jgi:hypothetical protein